MLEPIIANAIENPIHYKTLVGFFYNNLGNYNLQQRLVVSQDLSQDTLIKAVKHLPNWSPQKGTITQWLLGIAKKNLISHHRQKTRHSKYEHNNLTIGDIDIPEPLGYGKNPLDLLLQKEAAEILHKAISTLPENYRQVINLKYFSGLKGHEIAKNLDVPEATIKTWARRAMVDLRDMISDSVQVYLKYL